MTYHLTILEILKAFHRILDYQPLHFVYIHALLLLKLMAQQKLHNLKKE